MSDSIRFLKRSLSSFALSILIPLLIVAVGCGGGSTTPTNATANSAVQVKIGDDPADSVIAFEITVDSLVLTDQNNVNVQAINSPTLELTHLADTNEPLSFLNIQQDTYKQATLTV